MLNEWDKINLLTALWEHKKVLNSTGKKYNRYDKYLCDCWNEKWIRRWEVEKWNTKSCWCLSKKLTSERFSKHWDDWTRFYRIFVWLKARCNTKSSKSYPIYWWRWIKCCRNSYKEFKEDMYESYIEHIKKFWEKNTSIDRINTNWNYCKENCRWATMKEQESNRRDTWFSRYWISSDTLVKETWLTKHNLQNQLLRYKWDFANFIENINKRFWKKFIIKQK